MYEDILMKRLKADDLQKKCSNENSRGKTFVSPETFRGGGGRAPWNLHLCAVKVFVLTSELTCPDCRKTFRSSRRLKLHARTHQPTREMYLCSWKECDRAYFDKHNLNAHMRMYHEGHRFSCGHEGCDRTFSSKVST